MAKVANSDAASLQDGMQGSCLCGAITLTITQLGLFDKPNGHICHCVNCRQSSGAASLNILCLPTSNVTFSDPQSYLKTYLDNNTGSGNTVARSFCGNCGSSIGSLPVLGMEKLSMVALGLFPKMPVPEFEVFTKDRVAWLRPATDDAEQCQSAEAFAKYAGKYLQ